MPEKVPLRIIHCIRAPVGGVFRHVADLAESQHDAGHSVGLICDSSTGGNFENERIERLEPFLRLGVTRVAMRRQISSRDMLSVWQVAKEILRRSPDVLHSHGAKGGAYARMIGALLRLRGHKVSRFYSPHGGSLHYDPSSVQGRVYFVAERILERMTDGLIFVSRYEAEQYASKVRAPEIPSRVIYNGLRAEEFEPVKTDPDAADFLFIGTLRDLKGPDLFIRAVARLAERLGDPPTAVIVGAGDGKSKYETLAGELGISGNVRFLQPMPARDAFRLAGCVVIPSRAESLPYIVLETIAAQKPIVTTNVGGIPEIFGAESDRLVRPGDDATLAAAMASVLNNPDRARQDARNRSQLLRETFSLAVMAEDVERFYRDTMDGVRRSAIEPAQQPKTPARRQMFIRQ